MSILPFKACVVLNFFAYAVELYLTISKFYLFYLKPTLLLVRNDTIDNILSIPLYNDNIFEDSTIQSLSGLEFLGLCCLFYYLQILTNLSQTSPSFGLEPYR